MIIPAQNDVNLYQSLNEDRVEDAYVLLSTHEVTFITNRLHVWSKMIANHLKLVTMCEESKSAHLDFVAQWLTTISKATKNSLSPLVFLPEKQYKAALLLLHVTCQMEVDIHRMIEHDNGK
jgi:hypothetical protein